MTENATADSSRGMPFYEKLRRDLRETLQKKRILDQSIASLEENIYRVETSYLEDTSAGNIIKGFDNYIKGAAGPTADSRGTVTRRKGGITDADRIFSRSSANFVRENSQPASGTPTSSLAPTPSSFPLSARESNHPTPTSISGRNGSVNKKKRAPDDDDDAKSTKRGKISYGRD
ncbi:hypothetical protein BLS_003238 [Venturia inaequalis]|uniref:Chromatin modification-related protein EAF6 n=1 Tax=Venturia inaequalis TaxID=5025 RepID=A0A8H3ULW7_VENIN|nr:hypothetical protein EG328_005267 [Venturia inaequalis]KAE9974215.1 hypothetical protein BLS_003238 [Venturia inaequalis]KAE9992603.1 hypothetical protein EG327_008478 [Venturia inaequalis]RDI89766.1 hypothetical protein Vi05172_g427 [Venturia inaequalis]